MINLSFWTYCEKEISDLKPEFEKAFGINLIRDYENVWEWIWNGHQQENKINISREHNWKTGEYSKPLRIHFQWSSNEIEETEFIQRTQRIVKSDIYFGTFSEDGRCIEEVFRTIKYET